MPSPSPSRSQLLALQQQHPREFAAALRRLRWRQLGSLWLEFGVALGSVVSPVMLTLIYLTVFVPFGVIGRLSKSATGWVAARRSHGKAYAELRSPA